MTISDTAQRFLFENIDVRGERVELNSSLQSAFEPHAYPIAIRRLLGEMAAAAVLLSTTLKFDGSMSLQARSNGSVSVLMVECTNQRTFRSIAHWKEEPADNADFQMLLSDGQLVITIDPVQGKRHQGIVPLKSPTLANCFTNYFQQSEQLLTNIWLASDGQCASGFLLQALPANIENDETLREEHWNYLTTLTQTMTDEELLTIDTKTMLYRLFHEEDIRLFDAEPVSYRCTCSRERTAIALQTVDPQELNDILVEQGAVNMDCQFCNTRYSFSAEDVAALLASTQNHAKTLH
ncbi:MAG: Hsp33 family molecular chaperone HslO [Endozoicomonadaceae bacterium]|nr:Hsp33 family molecular chaperone HslO [Endozoicomonadaceae bacterium]